MDGECIPSLDGSTDLLTHFLVSIHRLRDRSSQDATIPICQVQNGFKNPVGSHQAHHPRRRAPRVVPSARWTLLLPPLLLASEHSMFLRVRAARKSGQCISMKKRKSFATIAMWTDVPTQRAVVPKSSRGTGILSTKIPLFGARFEDVSAARRWARSRFLRPGRINLTTMRETCMAQSLNYKVDVVFCRVLAFQSLLFGKTETTFIYVHASINTTVITENNNMGILKTWLPSDAERCGNSPQNIAATSVLVI